MESRMESPQKIKSRITICSSNLVSGYLSKGSENTHSKRYLHTLPHPHVHCWDYSQEPGHVTTKCSSMEEWIKKM